MSLYFIRHTLIKTPTNKIHAVEEYTPRSVRPRTPGIDITLETFDRVAEKYVGLHFPHYPNDVLSSDVPDNASSRPSRYPSVEVAQIETFFELARHGGTVIAWFNRTPRIDRSGYFLIGSVAPQGHITDPWNQLIHGQWETNRDRAAIMKVLPINQHAIFKQGTNDAAYEDLCRFKKHRRNTIQRVREVPTSIQLLVNRASM